MSKFIVNLKRFDTEKATLVSSYYSHRYMETYVDENDKIKHEFCTVTDSIYKTINDNYFIVKTSNAKFTNYTESCIETNVLEVIDILCKYQYYDKVEEFFHQYLQDA